MSCRIASCLIGMDLCSYIHMYNAVKVTKDRFFWLSDLGQEIKFTGARFWIFDMSKTTRSLLKSKPKNYLVWNVLCIIFFSPFISDTTLSAALPQKRNKHFKVVYFWGIVLVKNIWNSQPTNLNLCPDFRSQKKLTLDGEWILKYSFFKFQVWKESWPTCLSNTIATVVAAADVVWIRLTKQKIQLLN